LKNPSPNGLVEWLKVKALSSSPSTTKKNKMLGCKWFHLLSAVFSELAGKMKSSLKEGMEVSYYLSIIVIGTALRV
jgi:hypothetical protein